MVKTLMVPAGLFLLNFLVGLIFINEGLFHMDSVALAMAVEKTYQTGILHPAALGRYGAVLVNAILYLPFYLLGQNAEFITRLSSIFFHACSVVAFYYFIKSIFNDEVQALIGALLLSFTPLYFNPNTYGKEHGMGLFFLLMSFTLLQRSFKGFTPFSIGLASVCYVFAISVREAQLSTLLLFILLFLSPEITWLPFRISLPPNRLTPKVLLSFWGPLITLLGVMIVCYLLKSARDAELINILKPTLFPALDTLISSMPLLIFAFLFLGIAQMIIRKQPFWTIFFILWLMLIFIHGCTKWFTPRFLDVVLIPIYVFASFSLSLLFSKTKVVASAFVFFCVVNMFIYLYPMISFRHHYNGEKRLAEYVGSHTEPNSVVITEDQFPFIEYYGKRRTEWLPISSDPISTNLFIKKIKQKLQEGTPVYYTDTPYLKMYEASSLYTIKQYFSIHMVGGILSEDYHRPELRFRFCFQKLYKVTNK